MPSFELPAPSFSELRKILAEYDGVANPFGNDAIKLKDPVAYIDQMNVGIAYGDNFANFSLTIKESYTRFYNDSEGLSYQTNGWNDAEQAAKSGYTSMVHYYNNGSDHEPVDEVVVLSHTTGDGYSERPGDIDLRISMVTGLAWQVYREEEAAPATDEQLATMIAHLKRSIARTRKYIISKMVVME